MNKKKILLMLVALVLVVCGAMGGTTLAYLMDVTTPVENVFTTSDIDITLEETAKDFKMIPGSDITKDPEVTVKANSEACYVFVKVEKSDNYSTYLADYTAADGWTKLAGDDVTEDVYYRTVVSSTEDQSFKFIKDDKVAVLTTVTQAEMTAAATTAPTLTFTAYACQSANVADANTAWTNVQSAVAYSRT